MKKGILFTLAIVSNILVCCRTGETESRTEFTTYDTVKGKPEGSMPADTTRRDHTKVVNDGSDY